MREHHEDPADHDRPPDHEDRELPEREVFQRVSVQQQHQRAVDDQADDDRVEARIEQRVRGGGQPEETAHDEPADLGRLCPEALHERVDPVLRAEVVVGVDAATEIGVVAVAHE